MSVPGISSGKKMPRFPKRSLLPFIFCVLFLFASCAGNAGKNPPSILVDEVFAHLFPACMSELAKGNPEEKGPLQLSLLDQTVDRIMSQEGGAPIIASPIAAANFVTRYARERISARNIVVIFPDRELANSHDFYSVEFDFTSAYAKAGARAAKAVNRKLRAGDNQASCAVVFGPGLLRNSSALDAFSSAFGSVAEASRLDVITIDQKTMDKAGATQYAVSQAVGTKPAVLFLAIDNAGIAEEAGSSRDYVAYTDTSSWEAAKALEADFDLRIRADHKEAGKTALRVAAAISEGKNVARITKIPLRVE